MHSGISYEKLICSIIILQAPEYQFNSKLIDVLLVNDYAKAGKEVFKNKALKSQIMTEMITQTKVELKQICRKETMSILRGQRKSPLENFSFVSVSEEIRSKLPLLWQYLEGCISNPRQEINKQKKGDALLPHFVTALSTLIHLYNRDMNTFQMMNSLIMMKGGCKKSAFGRLNAIGLMSQLFCHTQYDGPYCRRLGNH